MIVDPADAAGVMPRAVFHTTASANPMLRGPQVAYSPEDDGGAAAETSASFSIDDAVAALDSLDPDEDQDQAAGGEQTQSEGATSTPDDAAGAAETQTGETNETQAEEGAVAPSEPPKYWSQDAKAKFAELPPEIQAVVLEQEGPREAAAQRAKDEAAAVRARADKDLQDVQSFSEELQSFLPQAVQTFRSRWGDNPDWAAYAAQHGAQAMTVAKEAYLAEREELSKIVTVSQQAETKAFNAYVAQEFEALKTVDPELADPEKGQERRVAVVQYLQKEGLQNEQLKHISAIEMKLARKAMLYDQAQSKAVQPKPAPKPAPAQTKPLARGAAAVGATDPKARVAQTANRRFGQTRSIADAAAYLDSLED